MIRLSTKKSFDILRNFSPLLSPFLDSEIIVTKKFFNHITYSNRRKGFIEEQLERALIIPLIPDILQAGKYIEKRNQNKIIYHRIEKKFQLFTFAVIIEENKGRKILFSCFRVQKKELVSVS